MRAVKTLAIVALLPVHALAQVGKVLNWTFAGEDIFGPSGKYISGVWPEHWGKAAIRIAYFVPVLPGLLIAAACMIGPLVLFLYAIDRIQAAYAWAYG